MEWKIKKVILWPKNQDYKRKEIDFDTKKVNVIVGDSQTGKSSIIPIIDYCLCSSKCAIPVGPIRNYTEWFGILAISENTEFLLARKEPGSFQSTNQMFYQEGASITIPEIIVESNRTSEQVSNRLNQLCKLPSLDFATDPSDKQPYESRPSFKDFLAFCFQSQHIIANPYTLFYQADTIEHKLKLRTVFPLALGLIQANTLELERRLSLLNQELNQKKGILEDKNKIRNAWQAEIKGNYIKAIEYGILKDTPFPEESWQLEDYVIYLQRVPELVKEMKFPTLSEGITSRVANYIAKVEKNESQIMNQLEEKSFQLYQIKSFKNTSTDYELAIKNQQSRLEPVNNGWLEAKLKKLEGCPVCGSVSESAKNHASNLIEAASSIKEKISQINNSKDVLDKEISEIEKEIIELEKQLNSTRLQLDALGRENQQLENHRKSIEQIFRYVGKIEQNLKNLHETDIDSDLVQSIKFLEGEIADLQRQLLASKSQHSRDAVINRIGVIINHYKRLLRVEEAENPTLLDEKQLTLKITTRDNRTNYLWEIGSGSNWMGYHISALLALQEFFLSLNGKNHVPSFLIFDQPSQAYFPETLKDDIKGQSSRSSDDLERVRAIFLSFSDFVDRTKYGCQVIVLEHASPEFWGDIKHMHYVGGKRWIKEDALIPKDWLDEINPIT